MPGSADETAACRPLLFSIAYGMTGSVGDAEDIVQDAFLGLYRRWDKLRDTTYPLAYVRASVLNGCRTAMRRKARESRLPFLTDIPVGSAESHALLGEEQRQVARALSLLPSRQREALVLRYYLDLSEEEIAQTMGISRGTVKSATHRGLAAIGRFVKEAS